MAIEILSGNELIVQGALEAGFSLYTGYPGSPLADYFNILNRRKNELKDYGIRVVIGNSEANAAAMASGAKQVGRDCLVAMKSMGLHVASDALSVGNFANPHRPVKCPESGIDMYPGVVVVVGDDPWSTSTSTPADSRYLFKHLHIPFLEPSTPQELKDWMKEALELSQMSSVYSGVLLTTFMAEGGGRVDIGEIKNVEKGPTTLDPAEFDLSKNVMVPPNSLRADVSMIEERFPKVFDILRDKKLDKVFGHSDSKIGFLSSGVIFETAKQVMEEANLLDSYPLYKLAASYPLIPELLLPYLEKLDHLVVIEEKRGFLESELRSLCQENGLSLKIHGKKIGNEEGFPSYGGLNFEIIRDKLEKILSVLGESTSGCEVLNHAAMKLELDVPRRLPTFCPGCPHRETLSLLKEIRKDLKRKGVDLITHGDVGCYSLSFLEPFKEMHNLSAMGQGGALGAGVDLFSTNPSVVLMGDSTFFHSGLTDISNSVQAGHDITYILLDNDNTAMTGHQMSPSTGHSVEGLERPKQEMLKIVSDLGVNKAVEINPSDRYFYKNLLAEFIEDKGTKVIVSSKECALTFHGRRKAFERKIFAKDEELSSKVFYQINSAACENCRVCVEMTGCPGLTETEDAYGPKVAIDPQICVSDGYCSKLKACPSFELVEVSNYHPMKYRSFSTEGIDRAQLPEPTPAKDLAQIAEQGNWRAVVTGVGGTGVTTISRVLAEAAKKMGGREDLDFKFVDQKGLAQRNGRVTGHMAIFPKGTSYGAVTPVGTADLLLSTDLLDGSEAISFLQANGQAVIDSQYQMPTTLMLDREVESPSVSKSSIQSELKETLGKNLASFSMKEICEKVLGKSVYASSMSLGVAYQSASLPFSLVDIIRAFEKTIRQEEMQDNMRAFTLGRMVVISGEKSIRENFVGPTKKIDTAKVYRASAEESFLPWHNGRILLEIYDRCLEKLVTTWPDFPVSYLAQYLHDIFVYDRGAYAEEFVLNACKIKVLYRDPLHQKIALRTLAKTYWVKDEIFTAHLMISPVRKLMDENTYQELGKGIRKTFLNRPRFEIFGKTIEFDISPRPWMLRVMRHMRILRFILRSWHKKEKNIASRVRLDVIDTITKLPEEERYTRLKKLENINGYREVRYEKALDELGEAVIYTVS